MLAGDEDAFERLETFLVAFLDADVHAERVAGLENRNGFFHLCRFDTV